eukprot:5428815-Pyramimonas_sp.AAC.1
MSRAIGKILRRYFPGSKHIHMRSPKGPIYGRLRSVNSKVVLTSGRMFPFHSATAAMTNLSLTFNFA